MIQRAVKPGRSRDASRARTLYSLSVLLLSALFCAPALGATGPVSDCDRTADQHSLEVPVSELSVNIVGHIVVESNGSDAESQDALPASRQSAAPTLDLTPRLAIILESVFSAVAIETMPLDPGNPASSLAGNKLSRDVSRLPPVAGDAGQPESAELTDPEPGADGIDTVPSLQRQMHRTDI